MPTFEIPDGPTTVELSRSGDAQNPGPATGSIVFNVTNKSADGCGGRLSVVPSGNSKVEWFAIEGDRERNFAVGETQTAKINISVPREAAAGDYPFKLRAVAVNDPDNDHAEGPVATARVPGAAPPAPKKSLWWLWLLIALLVLALVGVGVWFAFFRDKGPEPATTVEAPDYTAGGLTVEQAKKDPKGFKITETAAQPGGKPPGTILSQDPAPKAPVKPGQEIKVTFDPGVDVPQVANKGLTLMSAVNELARVHLTVSGVSSKCATSGTNGEVVGQSPSPPAKAPLNGSVQLSVRTVTAALAARRGFCGRRMDVNSWMKASESLSAGGALDRATRRIP